MTTGHAGAPPTAAATPTVTIALVLPEKAAAEKAAPEKATKKATEKAPEKASKIAGTLTITNVGHTTIRVVNPAYTAALSLIVFDRNWDQVAPDSVGKAHVGYAEVELAAGASASFPVDDLAFTTATARMRFKLSPGVYHVAAVYHPGSSRLPADSAYPLVVTSPMKTLLVE